MVIICSLYNELKSFIPPKIIYYLKTLYKELLLIRRCISLFSLGGVIYYKDLHDYYAIEKKKKLLLGEGKSRKLKFLGKSFSYISDTRDVLLIKYILVGRCRYGKREWILDHQIDLSEGIPERCVSDLIRVKSVNPLEKHDEILNVDSVEKYKLAIVAIAKNEADYIMEWCAFHKIIGVDVIFLYDNDSSDGMPDLLQPYIEDGFVVYNQIHGDVKQLEAYNDALKRYGGDVKYMAFVDCDEFLMPMNSKDKPIDIIERAFSLNNHAGGLGLNWCCFGSSGLNSNDGSLVLERFLYRSTIGFESNAKIKSIVKPTCIEKVCTPHYCGYKNGYYCININGEIVMSYWSVLSAWNGLRINHYFCKSREEYMKRRSLGRADVKAKRDMSDFWSFDKNEIKDDSALSYTGKVKDIINEMSSRLS